MYGGIDGSVTTFAIAAGVAGAGLSPVIIVALGLAHVLADGFSMAAGNYSGTKAEQDHARRLRSVERRPLREDPEGERHEIREILRRKGLGGGVLEAAASAIAANEAAAFQLMLKGNTGWRGASAPDARRGGDVSGLFAGGSGAAVAVRFGHGRGVCLVVIDDGGGVFRHRGAQVALVAGAVMTLGRRDPGDRRSGGGDRVFVGSLFNL